MHVVDINFGQKMTENGPVPNVSGAQVFCRKVHEKGPQIGIVRRKEVVRLVSMNHAVLMERVTKLILRDDLPRDFTLYYFQQHNEEVSGSTKTTG